MKKLPIFESQQYDTGVKVWPTESYEYRGYDRTSGLHIFCDGDKGELFAKRKDAPAGWHIKRGAYCYEFVRSQ